ncbi:MAG: LLM class flavin-dependent oxidoreductase [Sphingomonadales bacterium]|nr:LLM class flavin-dependent oxidoreductase [Sphingomonadales bacterium]
MSDDPNQVRTTVSFDMRSPAFGAPTAQLYGAAVEMAAFADRIGVAAINLMQHHGSEDGYLPQPFTLCAAMAAVTKRIRFSLGAVILPLHDPVEIAEQIALVDLLSNGRASVIFGAGYVPSEFAMFGKSLKDRAKLLDSGIETIIRALDGERFETAEGRPVFVRPLPVQNVRDIIMAGGAVPAAARRAARYDIGLGPMTPTIVDTYLEECAKHGRPPRQYYRPVPGQPLAIHLCEDPDAGWDAIAPHAVHVITEYAKWAEQEGDASNSPFKGLTDPAVLRHAGLFAAWPPEHLIEHAKSVPEGGQLGFQPLLGGLDPAEGWKSLKLLEQALPHLRRNPA